MPRVQALTKSQSPTTRRLAYVKCLIGFVALVLVVPQKCHKKYISDFTDFTSACNRSYILMCKENKMKNIYQSSLCMTY